MQTLSNSPELSDLTTEERTSLKAALEGLDALKKTFDHWMMIGRGLRTLREKAHRMNSRFAFDRMRHQAGLGMLNKATVSLLLKIVDLEVDVVRWRETLTSAQRFEWASPSAINKHCPLFKTEGRPARESAMPKEPGINTVGAVNLARDLQQTRKDLEAAQAHIQEIEANKAERPRTARSKAHKVQETFPEIPENPDDPYVSWRWHEAEDEIRGPAAECVLGCLVQEMDEGWIMLKDMDTHGGGFFKKHYSDYLRFALNLSASGGSHIAYNGRVFSDWISPEVLRLLADGNENVAVNIEISVRVPKKDFEAAKKVIETEAEQALYERLDEGDDEDESDDE